ncbi:MAG: succinylglutamate desuccinylase/aspartoacylase family protein [Oligoflexia bacterium]|nr:succinylglutamate desuccinylase/aspartoacylase family protein [Oligoflexia bacterium]
MDFAELVIGKTLLDNPIKASLSQNLYNDKWLYLMAGIHGNEIEGIYLLKELLPWLKDSIKLTIPCILIQNIDIDSYLFPEQGSGHGSNLNNLFPISSFRITESNKKIITAQQNMRPEIISLIKTLTNYPPQMVINFRTAKHSPKVISIGDSGLSLASYISKALNYPLVSDNRPNPRTMEAFIYDFFLCPVIGVRFPHFTKNKTVQSICSDTIGCIQQLLSGQIY